MASILVSTASGNTSRGRPKKSLAIQERFCPAHGGQSLFLCGRRKCIKICVVLRGFSCLLGGSF